MAPGQLGGDLKGRQGKPPLARPSFSVFCGADVASLEATEGARSCEVTIMLFAQRPRVQPPLRPVDSNSMPVCPLRERTLDHVGLIVADASQCSLDGRSANRRLPCPSALRAHHSAGAMSALVSRCSGGGQRKPSSQPDGGWSNSYAASTA